MKEGVEGSGVSSPSIITNKAGTRTFPPMCRQEIMWAVKAEKNIAY